MSFIRPYLDKIKVFKFQKFHAFLSDLAQLTNRSPLLYILDILYCTLGKGFSFSEYKLYHFYDLPLKIKKTYHSTLDNVRTIERVNNPKLLYLLRDKGLFLKRFEAYLGREFIDLRNASPQEFRAFLDRHTKFIAKPFNLAFGKGIEVYEGPVADAQVASMYEEFFQKKMYIVEEFIEQHQELSRVYPNCVNSIRIYTLNTDGIIKLVLTPSIRFGANGGKIDFKGNIQLLINQETGCVETSGYDVINGVFIEEHPNTCYVFKTLKIPFFHQAMALVKQAAGAIPEIRYIGWDVAITPHGPVLIEGNGAPGYSHLQVFAAALSSDRTGCKALLAQIR